MEWAWHIASEKVVFKTDTAYGACVEKVVGKFFKAHDIHDKAILPGYFAIRLQTFNGLMRYPSKNTFSSIHTW